MKKKLEQMGFFYRKFFHIVFSYTGCGVLFFCALISSCKGKTPPPTPVLIPENIIDLDLSIPGTFSAVYLYGPSMLCDQTVVTGSAIIECEYYNLSQVLPPVTAYASAYTSDLAASILNACSIPDISSEANFTFPPSISTSCEPGTGVSCTAIGINPDRTVTVNGICPF